MPDRPGRGARRDVVAHDPQFVPDVDVRLGQRRTRADPDRLARVRSLREAEPTLTVRGADIDDDAIRAAVDEAKPAPPQKTVRGLAIFMRRA